MLPSSSDIRYFVEVSSTGNLFRAADRLGISQPSLTLAIQRLEQSVGAPLLVRSKRGVTLTQAGKRLVVQARVLLQEWEKIRTLAIQSHEDVVGNFTIGCHPSVALYSLPNFLPKLLESHPLLEIQVVHDLSRKITESIISMRVDIGIVVNPIRHPDLVIRKLCDDEVTVWTASSSVSKVQDPRSGDGVLICDPDLLQTQDILKKLKKSGIRYQRVIPSSSLELIASLTASGCGFGILPGKVARLPSSMQLRPVKDAPVFKDEICLAYRVESREVRAIQEISSRIARAFS